ncbi:MAG: hypothetical protein HY897_03630 [Deltaproteobacteria bacterium]|nr:hypothetical protein [Deltaproteobacteria bacterium]
MQSTRNRATAGLRIGNRAVMLVLAISGLSFLACGNGGGAAGKEDASAADAGLSDANAEDGNVADAAAGDAGLPDAGDAGEDATIPEVPLKTQLLGATSSDGLAWTRLERPVVEEGASPGAMFDGQNIRLYFMRASPPTVSGLYVRISADGAQWQETPVAVNGLPDGYLPQDPAVVLLENGKYRMYYYEYPFGSGEPLLLPGLFTIASALSDDGLTFQREPGAAFQKEKTMDPSVIRMGDVWRMFTSFSQDPDWKTAVSVSNDGLTFTFESYLAIDCWVNSVIAVPGGCRMYCNDGEWFKAQTIPDIFSAFSSDGTSWVADPGVRVQGGGSMAAVKAGDTYWMFYAVPVFSDTDGGVGPVCSPPCGSGRVCCGMGPCAGTCVPDCRVAGTECPPDVPNCDAGSGLCLP